ncbi:elongation of very long chain fatty acids protein AAEL008004-like [Homalodisca vitripennis]|uniref:elongation of very long chain fatty acids protein AAEL008004-like n=1 Tax=Homalodisca vitripennis TaxID=197043 RepID=UPI001EEBFACE|nr:elongation of very long chain fatty acids protein AAEL008004-like [Homalodisca vitripennis]
MVLILRNMYYVYHYLNQDLKDPRTEHFPLMASPVPVLLLLMLYNLFVQWWGPLLMADRKPFNLDKLMIVYNLFQVIASAFIFVEGFRLGWGRDYNYLCQPVDWSDTPHNRKIVFIVYLYFCLKITDLLDTIFFVIRKKFSQVSFLHIYHHTMMVVLGWSGVKWLPGGHDTFIGWVNSLVHMVMYSYYLVTTLRPEYKGNLWWKKYITQLQMVQFLVFILHSVVLLLVPDCGYPRFTAGVFIPQNTFMFILFYDFYRKAYFNKKSTK